jgi:hypothetical protein
VGYLECDPSFWAERTWASQQTSIGSHGEKARDLALSMEAVRSGAQLLKKILIHGSSSTHGGTWQCLAASALGIVIWVLVWILCVSDLIGVNVGVIFDLQVASIPDPHRDGFRCG